MAGEGPAPGPNGRESVGVHSSLTWGLSEPTTTHCDEDRSCQWIRGTGISLQNLRKPTEATADPQLLELNPPTKTTEPTCPQSPMRKKGGGV